MSANKSKKNKAFKFIFFITIIIIVIIFAINSTGIVTSSSSYVVEKGSLQYEETTDAYILRNETVISGEDYENGMIQIASDNERVAKNEAVFRYYSDGEDEIQNQISNLDEQINDEIEKENLNLTSSDISSLETQIESILDNINSENSLLNLQDYKNKIDTYMSKKAAITGYLSPENSYVRTLINQRNDLENTITANSEIVYSPSAGIASYRIDGLEDELKIENFNSFTSEQLNGYSLKTGASIPINNEKAKIIDNFECYIVVVMNTEAASTAEIGKKVTLRFSNLKEVSAEITNIKDEENDRIIAFKIEDNVDDLIEYRKISLDIIWWKYTGWKVSNSTLIEEDGKTYVEIKKTGVVNKILVKVLRQNDTYSIIDNYSEEELKELGYSEDEINDMTKLKLYDEILLH